MSTKKLEVANKKIKSKPVQSIWKTCGSNSYITNSTANLEFQLPEFTSTRKVKWHFFEIRSSKSLNGYDCIIGRHLLKSLNIITNFDEGILQWDSVKVPMKDYEHIRGMLEGELNTLYTDLLESEHVQNMNARTNRILDAEYNKADIDKYLKEYCRLTPEERESLRKLLNKFETLFDGTLGK